MARAVQPGGRGTCLHGIRSSRRTVPVLSQPLLLQCYSAHLTLLYRSVKAEPLVSNTEAEFGSVCAA
jgi:hypothetical protein